MNQFPIVKLFSIATCCFVILLSLQTFCHSRRTKSRSSPASCAGEECQLPKEHYEIYSLVKDSLESGFDVNVKDLIPLLRSVEVLKRRYPTRTANSSVEGKLVEALLQNETLNDAISIFNSDQGRALINLYKSTSSGRSQNLVCSQWQLDELLRAAKILDSSAELSGVFAKIHKNYIKKSAKKCLKHACNSIDTSMSQLDSVLRRSKRRSMRDTYTEDELSLSNFIEDSDQSVASTESSMQSTPLSSSRREFEAKELELCRFFSRSNETECRLSGKQMSPINLIGSNNTLNDYLKSYSNQDRDPSESAKLIQEQCSAMRPLLDYNLAAFKWYNEKNFIDQQKLEMRLVWCPNLHYWMQIDRLCNELDLALREKEAQS